MVVVIEAVLTEVTDEKVRPSIVVIVADRHSEAPALISDACFGGDIGEGAVVVVMEQGGVRVWCVSFESLVSGAVHQVDVQPAVVVVIDQADSRAVLLDDEGLLRCAADSRFLSVDSRTP